MATSSSVVLSAAFLALLVQIAPISAHQGVAGYRPDQIHAVHAWARLAAVPGQPMAIFLVLHNESNTDDELIGLTTPIAKKADLRTHTMNAAGVMAMPRIPHVNVDAQAMVSLEPGGQHIMLFDIKRLPKLGSHFPLTLKFAHGKPQTVSVLAKSPTANTETDSASMEHMHH